MAIQTNFPNLKPTLLLDFANVKALDPRITFTRASEGRYYDGKTVAKAEENLMVLSQQFDNAAWVKERVTVTANTGGTTAPDGTATAEKIVEDSTTGVHRFYRSPTLAAGVAFTFSVFLKAAERGFAFLQTNNSAFDAVTVNLTTGAASSANGSPANIASTNAGNGWWRISFTSTTSATTDWFGVAVSTDGVWANRSYAGDGTSGIYAWGAQLEQRSSVTAYTATTTQPITNYIPVLMTAASGVARFDHNPVTEESLGLLIEEQRTNLLTYSEDFATTWTNSASSEQVNIVVSPAGTLSGDKLVEDTTTAGHYIAQTVSALTGAYTLTCYIKAAERSHALFIAAGGTTPRAVGFNLITGTTYPEAIGGVSPPDLTSDMTNVGNGWWRCRMSWTADGQTSIRIYTDSGSGTGSTTGDGYSGLYIWGAQLEAGSFPTSYIPTVAAQVTRSADSASMTGSNFSSWYRPDEGTLYAEGTSNRPFSGSPGGQVWGVATNATNRIFVSQGTTTNSAYLQVEVGGVAQANLSAGSSGVNGSLLKMAAGFQANNFALVVNASTEATDASGTIPVVNQALIGGSITGSAAGNWSGHIRKIAFYPRRLTNSELQALTS